MSEKKLVSDAELERDELENDGYVADTEDDLDYGDMPEDYDSDLKDVPLLDVDLYESEPNESELAQIESEKLDLDDISVDDVSINDPVKMYLKEIGRVPLL